MSYKRKIIEYGVTCADPLPGVQELKDYYETKYYQNANGTTTYETEYTSIELDHKLLEASLAIQALEDLIINPKNELNLLEFGCGEGFFLKQASKKTSWNIKGVDFSRFGIEKWNPELLNNCVFGDSYLYLNQFIQEKKRFDICVLRNLLEHLVDPKKLLTDLKSILNEDGLILITVPNDYSLIQTHALDCGHIDNDFWFLPPDHLYYFNTENIGKFVADIEYKIIEMYSSFPIDMFLFHPGSNYLKNKANGKPAHFARINLDLIMAKSGINNLLGLYKSMAKCGVGRDITIIIKPN